MKYTTLTTTALTLSSLLLSGAHAAPAATSGNLQTSKSSKCLAVADANLANGAKVRVAGCASNAAAQTWQFASSVSRTNTILKTATGNKCLDLPDGRAVNGAQVQVWDCNSANPNQFWNRIDNNIRFAATKYCLDIADGQARDFADGQVVQIWECNYSSVNQRITGPVAGGSIAPVGTAKPAITSTAAMTTTKTTARSTSTTTSRSTSTTTSKTTPITSSTQKTSSTSTSTTTRAASTSTSSRTTSSTSTSSRTASSTSTSARTTSSTSTSSRTTSSSSTSSTPTRTTTSTSSTPTSTSTRMTTSVRPTTTTASASTTSASSTSTSTTSASPTYTNVVPKPALTSVFKPSAKRMLAWGYDDRKAGNISSGSKISSYHHWELLKVKQMNSKVAYVPTYWGHTKNSSWEAVKAELGSEVPVAVAGFNEPDVPSQANMSPADAARSFYQNIDLPYGRRGANTIAPAIAWNIDGWLVPFMNQCALLGCQIDAVGLHIYLDLNDDVDAAVAEVKRRVNLVYSRTGKPIVLSELGLTQSGGGTEEQMEEFVAKSGAFLDNSSIVLAWALSAVFAQGNGWDTYLNSELAFFNANGTLRELAFQYMDNTW